MVNFNLVEVIDPTTITMTMMPRAFMEEFEPAYGDSWDEICDWLYDNPADYATILSLGRELERNEYFNELPKVQLPMCDLDDKEVYNSSVANGMHRITVLRRLNRPIKFTPYYAPVHDDPFTEVEFIFLNKITNEGFDNLFGWVKSMCLDNGEWVETVCASDIDNRMTLLLDKVVDHKVLLKKLHCLAMLDEFAQFGLTEIHCKDVYDDEDN